jgi:hypothetical protein
MLPSGAKFSQTHPFFTLAKQPISEIKRAVAQKVWNIRAGRFGGRKRLSHVAGEAVAAKWGRRFRLPSLSFHILRGACSLVGLWCGV